MCTYKEYCDTFNINVDPTILDFCIIEMDYYIYEGSKPLLTLGGNHFSHPSENLIRQMITDFQLSDKSTLGTLSSPILYSFQKDILSKNDPFVNKWEIQMLSDPFVIIKTSNSSSTQLFQAEDALFAFSIISLTGIIGAVNNFAGKVMSEMSLENSELHPFPEIVWLTYNGLTDCQKVALQALSTIHHSGIVMPLLLILGEITSVEYVKGLISLKIQSENDFSENLAGVANVQAYLQLMMNKSDRIKQINQLIKQGEGDSIEFKSTLRWDIRAGKTNPIIERSCLKTIAAFLNSNGGSLLIGVRDDGSIEGIDTDKFANEDKFLLHLWTLIRTCLGRDYSPFIHTRLDKVDGKIICAVDCIPSIRPVFLRQPGFDEEMFIRVGPSSNAMNISEALKYIEDHFIKK